MECQNWWTQTPAWILTPTGQDAFHYNKANHGFCKGNSTWKKNCICLQGKEQTWKPSWNKQEWDWVWVKAVFSSNGDADQIHQVLLEKFPVLGVMWQLHTSASCREFPQHGGDRRARSDSGMMVFYLFNQATLYIRPLQRDISKENRKPYSIPKVRNAGL